MFELRPYSKRISRSLVKEPKIYFYDYCRIQDEALRFENMVALELNRAVTLWTDFGFGEYQLWYLRNKEKHEVDFVIAPRNRPPIAIECKWSASDMDPSGMHAFRRQYPEGDNFIVAQDVDRTYEKSYGNLRVNFVDIDSLILRLFRICPPRRLAVPSLGSLFLHTRYN